MKSAKYSILLVLAVLCFAPFLGADVKGSEPEPAEAPEGPDCSLLDDAKARGKMDGLLRWLLVECGREDELGQVRQDVALPPVAGEGTINPDVQVNDSSGDSGSSTTQSETAISVNEVTGTLCSGYNDSYSGLTAGSFTGFSRSTDGGATWDDRGALPAPSSGDPSVVWSRRDSKFYFAALRSGGLGAWRSDDDCQTFTFVASIAAGNDDKEIMAVDNNPTSPFYGRLYVAWTDFGAASRIYSTHSDDGGATWSSQIAISDAGADVQGAWPTIAPNGDVFVGWVRWNPYPSGPVDIEIVRSTDGGVSYTPVTDPMTGQVNPRDSSATSNCGRPALNQNIRYLPSPQLSVGPDGALHVVYSYDPDGLDVGDVIDVYYRRSTDSGTTWGPEVRLNDDAGLNDQYYPTLSVSPENIVVTTFYDRRLDPANQLQDTFKAVSADGGLTWLPNERVSDVSTPIYLDPNLAACYHGDYDQNAQIPGFAMLQWSDDRLMFNGHNDPDVWFEAAPVSDDYVLLGSPSGQEICAPADAVFSIEVLGFQGFNEPVTLSASGQPAGTTVTFSVNPVTPTGVSAMTVGNTGAAAVGPYDILVSGLSDPSNIIHDATVALEIFDDAPGAPTLTSPANGAMNVEPQPTFEWTAISQARSYQIDVATDPGFGNIVFTESGITDTTLTPAIVLDTNTPHYWRVKAENTCDQGAFSSTFSFTTEPAPGECAFGVTPITVFYDDLESGAPDWTHSAGVGPDTWGLSTNRPNSGLNSFYAEDVAVVSDQYLVSPPIALPVGEAPLTLQFFNWQTIESTSGGSCYDGAVVEVTTDGGANWVRLESELLTDPYDGAVSSCCSNPIQSENAWCGDPQDWLESIADLDAFAGELVQFRFRLATDSSVSREGWYIDDVKVQSCSGDSLFVDGFESGDVSAWSENTP